MYRGDLWLHVEGVEVVIRLLRFFGLVYSTSSSPSTAVLPSNGEFGS
jgi:hypothetical protein